MTSYPSHFRSRLATLTEISHGKQTYFSKQSATCQNPVRRVSQPVFREDKTAEA